MSDLELIIKRDSLNDKYLANYATDETGQRWVNKKLVDEEIKDLEQKLAMQRNKAHLLAEDIECVHKCLDDENIIREDEAGHLSIWGRICRLKANIYKVGSDRESELLQKLADAEKRDEIAANGLRVLRIDGNRNGDGIPDSITLESEKDGSIGVLSKRDEWIACSDRLPEKIIDVCCGSRMFWFDKNNPNVIFNDVRNENHILCDGRKLNINPDTMMDFADLSEIENGSMKLVVFDPPHMDSLGENSWMAKKYGKLREGWENNLKSGFSECFRILDDYGILIFKWNETDIPTSKILGLTEHKPLFGHQSGKRSQTHWICFMKMPITPPQEGK